MKLPKLFSKTKRPHENPFTDPFGEASHSNSSHSSDRSGRSSAANSGYNSPAETSVHSGLKPRVLDQVQDPSTTEDEGLTEAFRIIDENGDGKISRQELGYMWKRMGEKLSDQELRIMVEEADADGDGVIDLGEFVTLQKMMGVEDQAEHSKEIRLAFDLADVDRNGHISAYELQRVMKKLGQQKITIQECLAMTNIVDADGDGLINFEEFERLMKSSAYKHMD